MINQRMMKNSHANIFISQVNWGATGLKYDNNVRAWDSYFTHDGYYLVLFVLTLDFT